MPKFESQSLLFVTTIINLASLKLHFKFYRILFLLLKYFFKQLSIHCSIMLQTIPSKVINFCMIICSFIGYMEWGKGSSMFVIQGEIEIFAKLLSDPISVLHPFIVLPLFGQSILIFSLFQQQPRRLYSLIGFGCIAFLMVFLLFIGLISFNIKIIASIIPFIIVSVVFIKQQWKNKA